MKIIVRLHRINCFVCEILLEAKLYKLKYFAHQTRLVLDLFSKVNYYLILLPVHPPAQLPFLNPYRHLPVKDLPSFEKVNTRSPASLRGL